MSEEMLAIDFDEFNDRAGELTNLIREEMDYISLIQDFYRCAEDAARNQGEADCLIRASYMLRRYMYAWEVCCAWSATVAWIKLDVKHERHV